MAVRSRFPGIDPLRGGAACASSRSPSSGPGDLEARYRAMLAELPGAGWGDASPVTAVYLARVDPTGTVEAALANRVTALGTLPRDSE